ncbi:MAG: hypothetical protein ACFB9M_19940 [Myxococcota bacterium]
MNAVRCSIAFIATAVCSAAPVLPASAAFPVQVLEGVGPTRKLPEFRLGVGFRQDFQQAAISREFVVNAPGGEAREVSELDYTLIRRELLVRARVGIYSDLELRVTAPIVFQLDTDIEFAEGVEGNSTIFGSPNANDPNFALRFPITTVPQERNRAGFGDLQIGLAWSPITDTSYRAWPTVTLALDVTVPTGDPWDPADTDALPSEDGTGGVGLGQTTFDVSVGLSKRSTWGTPALDPYFILGIELPVAISRLDELGYNPPIIARARTGTELIFAQNETKGSYYGIDLGVVFRFIGSGRTRSPLSDYLPDFDQTNVASDLITGVDFANPANYRRQVDDPSISCLTDPETGAPVLPGVPCGEFNQVEQHFQFDGHFGFRLQPSRIFSFVAGVNIGFQNDHFITGELPGEDTDPPSAVGAICGSSPCVGTINQSNSLGQDERSAFFDPRYDSVGGRFRAEDIFMVGFYATAVARF